MRTYRIKTEYLELWGDCDEHTRVTDDDVSLLAIVWEKTRDELMPQLEAVDDGAAR